MEFSKVFDSVDRNTLFKVLRHHGIPLKITNAITAMYTNSLSRVHLDNHLHKSSSINTGVLEGDVCAPFPFIIVVDYILWQIDDSHRLKTHAKHPEENLPDLDFIIDIVLFDETQIAAAEHYGNLQISPSQVGLRINNSETKMSQINYHREGAPN